MRVSDSNGSLIKTEILRGFFVSSTLPPLSSHRNGARVAPRSIKPLCWRCCCCKQVCSREGGRRELGLERGRELWPGPLSLSKLMSPPCCSQTVPTALCPGCSQSFRDTDLFPPLPAFCACSASAGTQSELAPSPFHRGKCHRHRLAGKAQRGLRSSQALQEALLADRPS